MKGKEVTKECSYCKVQKDLSCFGKSKAYKSGINGRCKECMNASNKRTQAKDPHHYLMRKRASWLMRNYKLTLEQYDDMLEAQGHKCAICSSTDKGKGKQFFCVDHCHTTGKVRGLLCAPCNKALGQLGDTEEALQRALDYLNNVD